MKSNNPWSLDAIIRQGFPQYADQSVEAIHIVRQQYEEEIRNMRLAQNNGWQIKHHGGRRKRIDVSNSFKKTIRRKLHK